MKVRFPLVVCSVIALIMAVSHARGNSRTIDFAGRRADIVEDKRVEKKLWTQPQSNSMMDKRFPMEEWDKHFSSVGSKRAPIAMKQDSDKEIFETKMIDRKEVDIEMSRWNDRMADLHKKAGIEMEDRAQWVADQQLYSMMLQDTQQFTDLGDEVSLRDLNRYQFRSNRPEGSIPVEQAGSGR